MELLELRRRSGRPRGPRKSVAERLASMTVRRGDCLVFTGAPYGPGGHGSFFVGGRNRPVHRVAWALANVIDPSDLPAGLVVRHVCDTPRCVNPDHLVGGSSRDNFADMAERGRARNGASGPLAHECPSCGHRFG